MNLERAAQALVECGYAKSYWSETDPFIGGEIFWVEPKTEFVDPINNESQRQALLEWYKITLSQHRKEGVMKWWAQSAGHSSLTYFDKRIEAENECLEEILK